MSLIHLPSNVSADVVLKHLKEDGYCIMDNAISEDVVDAINAEIDPYLNQTDGAANEALGKKTRRCGAMPVRSPSSHQVIMHPTVVEATKGLLGENATTIQLNLTQLIAVGPGQKAQFLHRDEYCWDYFDHFPTIFILRSAQFGQWMILLKKMAQLVLFQRAIPISYYHMNLIQQRHSLQK